MLEEVAHEPLDHCVARRSAKELALMEQAASRAVPEAAVVDLPLAQELLQTPEPISCSKAESLAVRWVLELRPEPSEFGLASDQWALALWARRSWRLA